MAVAFKAALGNNGNTTSGTTLAITTTAAIDIGDLVVVRAAADNLNATTPTFTCADGGNTYTVHVQLARNATAAAGVAGAVMCTKATVARPAGSTITVTLSGAVSAKAAYAESFTGVLNTTRSAPVSLGGASTVATSPASGTIVAGDLVIGATAYETRAALTADADTTAGAWSAQTAKPSNTGGSDATNVTAGGQYKIPTGAGAQTYNVTSVSADWVAFIVVLQAEPEPSVTQAAYQFFVEGTESGAAAMAAINTPIIADITNQEGAGALRIRLQSTTAVDVPAADDWQLQWEKNASGSWTNVTTAGTTVDAYDAPALTGAATTTNRLGAGTGSFVAGEVTEDGVANDLGWTANNYTELLFSLVVRQTGVANGDTLRFRVLRNGATTGMTYTVTPTINVIRTPLPLEGSSSGIGGASATTLDIAVAGVAVDLAGVADGLSTTTSDLTITKAPVVLAGTAGGTSTVTAALARAVPMVAGAGGLSTVTAATAVARALGGASGGLSTVTAATAVGRALEGSAAGLATVVSNTTIDRGLTGSGAGLSTTVAALSSTGDVFDPSTITGLAVWLDASGLPTGALATWPNLGSDIDPTISSTPPPVVMANTLNGKSVVRFTASEGRLRGTSSVFSDLTIVYVVRRWGWSRGRALTATYPGTAAYNYLVGFHTSSADWMYDNGAVTAAQGWVGEMENPPTPWRLYSSDGTTTPTYISRFFIDGVQTGVDWPSGQGLGGTYNISGYSITGPEETMDVEVAELLIYDHKLADVERQQVEQYLRDKWLYVPPPVEMVGASSGTSTAGSTSLVFDRPLVVTAAGVSTAGATTLVRVLATTAAAGGLSTATGSLVLGRPLVAGVAGASSATGTLAVARSLAAAAAGVSTVTATTVARAVPLAATVAGLSTTTSAMATADALVASSGGITTVTGALAVARRFVASSAGVATTTATTLNSGAMSALTQASSTATGALVVARALAGSTSGIAATGGALAKAVPLVGGAPTPTLPAITGLGIQLDASQLVLADGAPVNAWLDLSGSGHSLTVDVSRSHTAPVLKTNELNGMSVIRYNGISNVLSTEVHGNYSHFFLVAKYRLATFDGYDGLLGATDELVLVGGGPGEVNFYSYTQSLYYKNGVSLPTLSGPMAAWAHMGVTKNAGWINFRVWIGNDRNFADRYWDGDVAEVIGYDHVLSDSERIQVEQYLNAKWFVPGGGPAAMGVSTTTSAVAVARRLVASSTGVATATASLSVAVSMTATSGGKMTPTAALARAVPLSSVVAGSSTASSVTVAVGRAMIAAANGSSTAIAAGVRVAYAMVAATAGSSTATGDTPAVVLNMMASSNGVSATGGELGIVALLFGVWNGQAFDAMYYGPYEVVDYLLVPPAGYTDGVPPAE